ncbi:MAG: hypothetical protein LBN26_09650 [Christensenellaceae bacterium]|jgi:spore maturation protein A|nr:hypothetical protein [Christensenellaceae bacterium]
MMNWLWGLMLLAGLFWSAYNGGTVDAVQAMASGAGEAVRLSVSLAGAYMLWMGLMQVAEEAGLVQSLGRLARPLLTRLFPHAPKALAPITLNLSANFFGLGSAATPFGLAAMQEFDAANPQKGVASDDMCMFLALNSSAVELLPTTVLALRAAMGSADASRIVAPTFAASLLSALAAVALAKALAPLFRA